MAEWTLAEAKEHLDAWLAADLALAGNQSYRMGEVTLTRADLATIKDRISFWMGEVERLTTGRARGPRVFRVVPRDL
ncbi:MAG: hypothetical protein JW821_04970 [Deltaproteobacteria bacterium]|nr:hypothetical protein [Deltaproteobacteria bacterium]